MISDQKIDAKKHPTEIDREIGRRIKTRRNALGMNQQSLAERIGVSYQQVQKYENGTDRVGASRLYAIATALDCDVAEFFHPRSGMSEAGAAYDPGGEAQRVLATDDGRLLVHAFLGISDAEVRRRLVELATTLAASGRRAAGVRRGRRPRGE